MAGIRIEGDTSGSVAEVDTNHLLRTTGVPSGAFSEATAGKFMMVDDEGNPAHFDFEGRVDTSRDSLAFYDPIDGAGGTPDIRLWTWTGTTMTLAQNASPSRYTINSGAITTINTNQTLTSIQTFAPFHEASCYLHVRCRPVNLPNTNSQAEWGFGTATGAATPTDGAYFRWKSDNTFRCVINFGGTEVESAALTAPTAGEFSHMEIKANAEQIVFEWESPYGTPQSYTVRPTVASSSSFNTVRQPIFFRVFVAGTAPGTAPQIEMGEIAVYNKLLDFNEPWPFSLVTNMGSGAFQSPTSPFAQTPNHANSTSPTSATLSNTAAGYTTLGGRYQFAAPAGAATDFALFGFQVPAGGRKLNVTQVAISAMNTGAAVATTATILDWAVAANSTAVSLATADTTSTTLVTSIGPRRVPLGMQGFLVGAGIGQAAADIVRDFNPPLVIEPGRFFHVIVQVPVGTATAAQVIRGDVTVNGYFE